MNQIAYISLMKFPIHFSFSLLHRTSRTSALTSFSGQYLPKIVSSTRLLSASHISVQAVLIGYPDNHSTFKVSGHTKGGK